MSAPGRIIGLGLATVLAALSVIAFVLVLAVVYGTTGDRGTVQGVPNPAATTTSPSS